MYTAACELRGLLDIFGLVLTLIDSDSMTEGVNEKGAGQAHDAVHVAVASLEVGAGIDELCVLVDPATVALLRQCYQLVECLAHIRVQ